MQRFATILIFVAMGSTHVNGQLLRVREVPPEKVKEIYASIRVSVEEDERYYKIVAQDDDSDLSLTDYPIKTKLQSVDTLALISELLAMEGDTRVCIIPLMHYNPSAAQLYSGPRNRYSIQVEALLMINQLYFKHPFHYSPVPLLTGPGGEESIEGELITVAFRCYREWFRKVSAMGLLQARSGGLEPLDKSKCGVDWIR